MESMMSDAEYKKVTVSISAPEKHNYKRSEDQITFMIAEKDKEAYRRKINYMIYYLI